MTSRRISAVCTALAPVLLLLGLLAGFVNHQILDGRNFASHVDAIRRDPAVSHQVGLAISNTVLDVDPNLIALRPLLEAACTALAGSPAFTPVVTATANEVHTFFTEENSDQIVLRLADIGSVLSGVLPAISPDAASHVPAGLDVTLGRVGSQSFAADTIRLTHFIALLAWLLPLLGLLLFVLGIWLAPDRLRAAFWSGWGIAGTGLALGFVWLGGSFAANAQNTSTLRGAVIAASWDELNGPLLRLAVLTTAAGALLSAAVSAMIPDVDINSLGRRAWTWVAHRPEAVVPRVIRAAALVGLGVLAVLLPATVALALVVIAGWVLLLTGIGELATLIGARRAIGRETARPRRVWLPVMALGAVAAVLMGAIVYESVPSNQAPVPVASSTKACNGHVELCSRRYNQVSFVAAHNAMSAADEPNWFIPEQPSGLVGALNAGVRVLLIDTWYGQSTSEPNRAVTAQRNYADALAQAKADFGQAVVDSAQRFRNSFAQGAGPVEPYMCHGLCETGSTLLLPALRGVANWMAANPREVVTFIIEDKVSPEDTVAEFEAAGLTQYVHSQPPNVPWPTLRSMINSGHRLVVMMEAHGGGTVDPWLMSAFDWVSDTSYSNPNVKSLNCDLNRGSLSDPLFMINNWLARFTSLITDARKVNAFDQLWPYAHRCQQERGHIPNFIAVNFYNEGDVFRVVDRLNGF